MNQEIRNCQNCKNEFTIEPEDFLFYQKIKVPAPTWCAECRRQRRLSWRNDFYFHSRKCDLCGKSIVSIYAQNSPRVVYCNKCWRSDKWDPKSYAEDIDFSRSFFEQFTELQARVPTPALINDDGIASTNCEYTQDFAFSKNCYMTFVGWRVEDCMYSAYIGGGVGGIGGKDIVDSMSVNDAQYIYDSIYATGYHCRNIYYSYGMRDSIFCYDCRDCNYCFLCAGLRHKSYCVKNKQYTKEEYDKIISFYKLDTHNGTERAGKEFQEFILRYPRRFAHHTQSVNVTGDELWHCKNVHHSFCVDDAEDSKYIDYTERAKSGYDISVGGEYSECYESITPDNSYRGLFTIYSWKNTEVAYAENCHSSKYLFGCAGLRSAEHCILNKQYAKGEYDVMKSRLVEHMQFLGEWGEFFPAKFSPFGYNETIAQLYCPLSPEKARSLGFKWQDAVQVTKGQETTGLEDMPESISDVPDSLVEKVLVCALCGRNYRIISPELKFYRKMRIPVPRFCFYCRNNARFRFRNPFNLWHRQCTCAGIQSKNGMYQNQSEHFHGSSPCPNEFETSYAPDRPEIVYCEVCYQSEIQ